ncbi:MAG TPA: NAD(P)/FAD-dependent oxidoreductase [Gemmatimonadales bacterium]
MIVGAGFGGLECAKALARKPVDVTLVDRNNYHLFTPLLYQVASSLLNPSDIAQPVRRVLRRATNVHCQVGDVVGGDLKAKQLRLADGATLAYDDLVLATGSTSNYFGMASVERVAHGLKDLPESLELRNHVLRCFEAAARERDTARRRTWMTFLIIGAGPTGVEYAGALSELVRLVLAKDFKELDMKQVRVVLVEGQNRVLPVFRETLGLAAQRELEGKGIEVRLGARVVDATADSVTLAGGERIAAATLVWAAGVKASPVAAHLGLPVTKSGRVAVDECLRVPGVEGVWAIGDAASSQHQGAEIPMLSAPAMQEGRWVARNVLRMINRVPAEPFHYLDKGIMATIGRNAAVAQVGPVNLKGLIGWLAWLALHLFYLIGFRNRLVVLVGWGWDYFRYDRPIRLIARANAELNEPR